MPNRIGITEAPSADLEKESQLLHLPLARKDTQGQIQPRSATVAELIATAQNQINSPSQIHRLRPDLANSPVYNMPANLQPQLDSGNFSLYWNKDNIQTLRGDKDFLQVDGVNIIPALSGIYRMTLTLAAYYTNTAEGGNHVWLPIMGMLLIGDGEHIPSTVLTPNIFSNGLTTRLGQASFLGQVGTLRNMTTTLEMRNIGTEATPSPSRETLQIADEFPRGQSFLLIEYLGKLDE